MKRLEPAPKADNTAPIVKTLTVPLDPARAFRLFTAEMTDWWPLDTHSISARDGAGAKRVTVTPEVGGPVFETKPDGGTARWGSVTEWAAGESFGMTWHVGRTEDAASHVRVTFIAVADGTRVTLIHNDWTAMGEGATALRASYLVGWDGVFGTCFARACHAVMATG